LQKEEKYKHIIVATLRNQALELGLTEEETDDYVQQIAITLLGGECPLVLKAIG
jgi:hypothetical protein